MTGREAIFFRYVWLLPLYGVVIFAPLERISPGKMGSKRVGLDPF